MNKFIGSILVALVAVCACLAQDQKKPEKLSTDQLVSKALAAVGAPDKLAAVKSRVMVGTGVFTTKVSPGKIGGAAQLVAADDKFMLVMLLNANDYPYEKFAFDGKDFTTAALPTGGSTPLGNFLKSNKIIVKSGLVGGVLSQSWPLLHPDKNLKLEAAGTAKIGDKNLYKLKVSGAGFADMTVSLYFEPDTFRHVRTDYFYLTGQLTSTTRVGGPAPGSFTLTEEFSKFTKVDDLVLPLGYSLEFTTDAGRSLMWDVSFSQVFNNQPIDAAAFKVS